MSRHPQPSNVEQVERMLDDGLDVDEIAVALRLSESEVGRIAGLLAERGPADPAPDVDVQAVADDVDALDDGQLYDGPVAPTGTQVKAAAVLVRRATSGTDLDDLAGALGIRHAVEPAERWLQARAAAVAEFPARPVAVPPQYGTPESAAAGGAAVQTLNGRIAALGTTVAQIRDWARQTGRPVPARGMIGAALVDEWAVAHAGVAVPGMSLTGGLLPAFVPVEQAAATPPVAVEPGAVTVTFCGPDDVDETGGAADECFACDGPHQVPAGPAPAVEETPALAPFEPSDVMGLSPLAAMFDAADEQPEHVHDPFVAWREDGIPYATCECGQTWERTTCTYCPAIVTALHVATHGPAHKHCAAKHTERTNP